MQKLCSVAKYQSIPLLYPEGMLFPSLHWNSISYLINVVYKKVSVLFNNTFVKG